MTYSVMKISFHVKMGRLNVAVAETVLEEYLTDMFGLWFYCAAFATETVGRCPWFLGAEAGFP